MMTPLTKIQDVTKELKLSDFERGELRNRLLSYIEYHPVTATSRTYSIFSSFLRALIHHPYAVAGPIAMTILTVSLGTVSYIAEYSNPGDTLYAIKVGVNEPVLSKFATSPYEKVEFETKLLERRIAEAKLLADSGKLTKEKEKVIAEGIEKHTKEISKNIDTVRESNESDANMMQISLTSTLSAGDSVVASITEESSEAGTAIKETVKNVQGEQATKQGKDTSETLKKTIAQIETELTRATELKGSISTSLSNEAQDELTQSILVLGDRAKTLAASSTTYESEALEDAACASSSPEISTSTPQSVDVFFCKTARDAKTLLVDVKKLIISMTNKQLGSEAPLDMGTSTVAKTPETPAATSTETNKK